MTGGIIQVGPVFCLIQVLPHSRLQSVLVEENRRGRASQETFPIGEGRRIFQMEGGAQAKAWQVQGTTGRGGSVQGEEAGLRGHQNWAARSCAMALWPGKASYHGAPLLREWPVLWDSTFLEDRGWVFLFSHAL